MSGLVEGETTSSPNLAHLKVPPLAQSSEMVLQPRAEVILMTPDRARALLKRNASNRKLRDYHVKRIARLIQGKRWRFNGDTIKIDFEGNLQDGQHRLQAIILTETPCLLVVVTGVERAAFATIDTMRVPRSYGDVVHLKGAGKHQTIIGTALAWLVRYDKNVLTNMQAPENKIENDEVELKFANCPRIQEAIERCQPIKTIVSPALVGFIYYVLQRANQAELADRMVDTLYDPINARPDDPFYVLRSYLLNQRGKRSNVLHTIAMLFKAVNFAFRGERTTILVYRDKGKRSEPFPVLEADTR